MKKVQTGDILSLRRSEAEIADREENEAIRVIVDEKKAGIFTLALIFQPYQRIRVRDDGRVDSSDLVGKNSFFSIEELSGDEVHLQSTVKSKDGSECFFLFPLNGSLVTSTTPQRVKVQVEQLSMTSIATTPKDVNFSLEPWLKRRFRNEGFLHIPNAVSTGKVTQCQRLLMHHLGIPGSVVPGGAQDGLGKLAGSLSNSPEIRELLLGEKILAMIADLMGGLQNIDGLTNLSAQIALRFPEIPSPTTPVQWHTDGLRQGRTHGFSLLVGICLSDVLEEDSGNLLVWPGTHVPIHLATVGDEGALDIPRLTFLLQSEHLCPAPLPSSPPAAEPETLASQLDHHDNCPPNLPILGTPYQLLAHAGDAVILHPDTAHTGGPNSSCAIRSMVYFRLRHRELKEHDLTYREDMWVDLPGLFPLPS